MESQYYIYLVAVAVILLLFFIKKSKSKKNGSRNFNSKSIIEQLDIEINLNPKDELAYYRRGQAKLKIHDRKGAYKDFCKARDLGYNKANEIIENQLADLERQNQLSDYEGYINSLRYVDRQKAVLYKNEFEDYTKMIKANPKNHTAYFMRAGIKELINDYQGAIDDLNKAIIIKRNFPDAIAKRGIVKLKMEDKESALKDLKLAEQLGSTQAKSILRKHFNT